MVWYKEVGQILIAFVMMLLFFLLVIRRKKLDGHIHYFTAAIGVGLMIEIITLVCLKFINPNYNTILIYTVGVIFFVFLFLFLYFHYLLEDSRLKKINKAVIALFLLCYLLSALFFQLIHHVILL